MEDWNLLADGIFLPLGTIKDVAETTARREASSGNLGIMELAALGKHSRSNGSNVGATTDISRDKDVVMRAKTVTAGAGNTVIATRDDDRNTLKTELHVFVALALQMLANI